MLSLQNIDLTLAKGSKLERPVLKKLNLQVNHAEFLVIMGENGTGKSTLFNVISGFLKPDAGEVILNGKNITHLPQQFRTPLIAKVMQDPRMGTMENMTVLENMAFALKRGQNRGLKIFNNPFNQQYFREKLSLLGMGLEDRLHEQVSNVSGGQRQALSLIMAILTDAQILLLDEITAALDPKIAVSVMQLADQIVRQSKRTCIMITHHLADAIKYGDRLLILKEGKFIKEYTALEKQRLTPPQLALEFGALLDV